MVSVPAGLRSLFGGGDKEARKAEPAAEPARRRLSLAQVSSQAVGGDALRGRVTVGGRGPERSGPRDGPEPAPQQRRRLSIQGVKSSQQMHYDDKLVEQHGAADVGLGYSCKKGLKPESPNQDDFCIIKFEDWGLYGVFDGHGPHGHDVSHLVQKSLPRRLYGHPAFWENPCEALAHSFRAVHEELEALTGAGELDATVSGTTCTVALHFPRQNKLWLAHVGDSRAILWGRTEANVLAVTPLTKDHKPNLPLERARVEKSGGEVRKPVGDACHRVFLAGRSYPGLAMSRAIGDSLCHNHAGVSCDPTISQLTLNPKTLPQFLLLCSDGVWEFIDNQEGAKIVAETLARTGSLTQATEALAEESWRRWIKEEQVVVDDITAILVQL